MDNFVDLPNIHIHGIVHWLTELFPAMEIFSKRWKIYMHFEGKPKLRIVPERQVLGIGPHMDITNLAISEFFIWDQLLTCVSNRM